MTARTAETPFAPVVSAVRWAALTLGAVLVAGETGRPALPVAWAVLLVGSAAWHTRRPGTRPIFEAGLVVAAAATTGGWQSPFVLCLVTPVMVTGFARGFAPALRLTAGVIAAMTVPAVVTGPRLTWAQARIGGQWAMELVLVAILAGYVRRIFGEVSDRASRSFDRASQLSEANELLVSLHRLAQAMPASLNLQEAAASTMGRLRTLVEADVAVLLLRDDASGQWTVGVCEGMALSGFNSDDDLPAALRAATETSVASLRVSLEPGEGLGAPGVSESGLYAPLRSRGALVALVALEHHEPGHYGRRELKLLDGFTGPAALAIDNARWFARLRHIGADDERNRIARDMHDRIGQSLAYLSFRLEHLAALVDDAKLSQELVGLHSEVRSALGEVRETLSDLRTDVSDGRGLVETLGSFLDRVGARTSVHVSWVHQATARLPLLQEREMWRIAQEAVANVERHAKARHLRVHWSCDGANACLTVADDGRGFSVSHPSRSDSYGLAGIRERADSIGAVLSVESEPYVGTLVECRLGSGQ